jgi:hypothetical protein
VPNTRKPPTGPHGHQVWQHDGPFDQKVPGFAFARKHPKPISKGIKATAAEAAVTVAEAIAVEDFAETNRLAAEFEALGESALTMAFTQGAEPGDPLRECWLAHERLRVSDARSNNGAEILTARTYASAEAAEVAATEAAAAEAAAAVEASIAAEAAAAGGAKKSAADALGARAALSPELPKEPGGGAGGMAEDAEEIPGRPVFGVGAREEFKTQGGSLGTEGANAAVQAGRSTPIKVLRSLEYRYALTLNVIIA